MISLTFLISEAYAMGPPPGGGGGQGGGDPITAFLPLILIFGIFYFLLIRPQQKKQKQHQEFVNNLQKGMEVVTSGGIIGKITGVTDEVVTLEIADKVRIKVVKNQIAGKPVKGDKAAAKS